MPTGRVTRGLLLGLRAVFLLSSWILVPDMTHFAVSNTIIPPKILQPKGTIICLV